MVDDAAPFTLLLPAVFRGNKEVTFFLFLFRGMWINRTRCVVCVPFDGGVLLQFLEGFSLVVSVAAHAVMLRASFLLELCRWNSDNKKTVGSTLKNPALRKRRVL